MSRNDRSDSLSVRQDDDPRRSLKAMQEETEQELRGAERTRSSGPDHQSPRDREGIPASERRDEEVGREVARSTREQDDDADQRIPKGNAIGGGGGNMTREPFESVRTEEPGKPD